MMRMTDDELDDVYFQAFDATWRKTGRGDSSDTAGLRSVADAVERRVLDRLWASVHRFGDRHDVFEWVKEMREELDRGE